MGAATGAMRDLTKAGVVALLLGLSLAASACRSTVNPPMLLEGATAAYHRGDYATTLQRVRPLAEQGYAPAQHNLGVLYVPQDYAEALRWFLKAAEQGHAPAQSNLGVMYATGQGVLQDDAEAVRWFRKAAEQGDAEAQNNPGAMYATGQAGRRRTRRRCGGIARLPRRASPSASTTSGPCAPPAGVCRRTIRRR